MAQSVEALRCPESCQAALHSLRQLLHIVCLQCTGGMLQNMCSTGPVQTQASWLMFLSYVLEPQMLLVGVLACKTSVKGASSDRTHSNKVTTLLLGLSPH